MIRKRIAINGPHPLSATPGTQPIPVRAADRLAGHFPSSSILACRQSWVTAESDIPPTAPAFNLPDPNHGARRRGGGGGQESYLQEFFVTLAH